MLLLMLACATKTLPIPEPMMGAAAPKTPLPDGETAPAAYGSLDCGLTVGFAGVDEELTDLLVQDNGELLVVAEAYKGRYQEALVMSLRDQGPSWFQVLGAGGDQDRPTAVTALDDGFMVTGGTWSTGAGQNDMWLLRLDAAGQLEWQRTYGLYDRDLARGYVPNTEGGLVYGEMADFGALWIQVDALGAVRGRGGVPGVHLLGVEGLPDGSALIWGTREDTGWAARVNSAGALVWEAQLPLVPVDAALDPEARGLWLLGAQGLSHLSLEGLVDKGLALPGEMEGLSPEAVGMGVGGPAVVGRATGGSAVFQLDEAGAVVWSQTLQAVEVRELALDPRGLVVMGEGKGKQSRELFGVRLNADTGASLCIQVPPVPELPASEAAPGSGAESAPESGAEPEEAPAAPSPAEGEADPA
ncbi:MAG: hypothetical protein VX899_24295 [Myxococcota bacterium]|nr:hypothetical protein [Myxococcota bacterium]